MCLSSVFCSIAEHSATKNVEKVGITYFGLFLNTALFNSLSFFCFFPNHRRGTDTSIVLQTIAQQCQ